MNKKFIKLLILLILSRSFDFGTTYIYTPNLTNETNILVKIFHFNYFGLLIIQIILMTFVAFCLYYYTKDGYKISMGNKTLRLKDFIPYFHYGNEQKYTAFFYKNPNINSIFFLIGYVVTKTLIYIGFIVGTSTILLITSENYKKFYKLAGAFTLYSILIFIVILFTVKFYKNEYYKYKNKYNQLLKE